MPDPDTVFRFGDPASGVGELDAARHRLSFEGRERELEPKAFAVLADLLAHAGELRHRDDLLDAVWGHRHVTPAVLSRAIAQIRKALDDPAEAPRFVQTVHALGYRFIAPVESPTRTPERGEPARVVLPPPAAPSPRGRAPWILAAVAALALLGGLLWQAREDSPGPGNLVAQPPTKVVLVPFETTPRATDLAPQVAALETAVLQRLRMLPGLRVERGKGDADPNAVVLEGDVVGTPDAWALRVRMRNTQVPFERTYPLRLKTLGSTAIEVQGDVIRRLRPDSAALLEAGVLDAEQLVRSAHRARQGLKRSDQRDAVVAFQRALQLDPTNADAWCFLGGMYLAPASENMTSRESVIPQGSDAIARGLRLDPASAHCWAKQGELLRLQGRIDDSEAAFRRSLAIEPALYPPRIALVMIQQERGAFARARDELERIVRAHPDKAWTHCQLIGAWMLTGEVGKARAFESVVYERHPDMRNVNWWSAAVDFNYGEPAKGIRRNEALADFDPDSRDYLLYNAMVAASIRDPAFAKQQLDKAGFLDIPVYMIAHAWLLFALDDPKSALAWLRDARMSPSLQIMQRALQAQSLALAGDRAAALREYARVYEDGWRDGDPVARLGEWQVGQLLNYAVLLDAGPLRGDLIAAADRELKGMRDNGLAIPWVHYQAAQIAAVRGDGKEAMAALDRAIDAGYTDVLSLSRDLPWRGFAGDAAFGARKARLEGIAKAQREVLAKGGAAVAAAP